MTEEVYAAKGLRDRKLQRALSRFFKPEYYIEVRKGLGAAGAGRPEPPREAPRARPEDAGRLARSEYVHTIRTKGEAKGYHPGRTTAGPEVTS